MGESEVVKGLSYREGDLVALADGGAFDLIIHGCNCFHTMGSGVAGALRARWPAVYAADCRTARGAREKLGSYSLATVRTACGGELLVVNAYTQFDYGRDPNRVYVDYGAIASVMREIGQAYQGVRIGLPMIGAGLARGDWSRIEPVVEEQLAGVDGQRNAVTVVVLPG
ncbi:O-acetyl-ADP-ribose deacetylase (regulator of RNase III) [Natronocella acetinitrilica]|uniref:O-acetyl-ADP-ribose deacetylase (Regulator of RNase III) n=1 Tax=Natronocella acetinitrilica TaxID=414046 RepID=A0AAE3G2N8_9GAMM|nr:macro domain-containing protein [Natronocella acetinitrilica]MCP1674312.1 O-acetyl-ADP-ribose deacetylase (regulator of RNase III) [Natronocella acetinitrilica]